MPNNPTSISDELSSQSLHNSFKYIVDSSQQAMAIFNLEGELKYSNPLFSSLWNIEEIEKRVKQYNIFKDPRFMQYYNGIKSLNSNRKTYTTLAHSFKFNSQLEEHLDIISSFSYYDETDKLIVLRQEIIGSKEEFNKAQTEVFENSDDIKNALDLSNIITEFNVDGELLEANDLFYSTSGYEMNEDSPFSLVKLRSGNMPASLYDNLWSIILNGKMWKGELENRNKSGEIYWTETIIVPKISKEASKSTFIGISKDISDRKLAEKEIINLKKQLDEEVEKRKEDIKDAVGELEAFSYSVSHDLRAPLRAITGFSGLLKEEFGEDMNEDALRYLKIIQDGTRQMAQLIDDLLQFSRVGRIELQKNLFDPHPLINEILKKEEINFKETLEVKIMPMPNMYGDAKTLKLVFTNLFINALKFSKDEEYPVISIGSKKLEGEDVFYIKDNGVGFDMRYADKLFKVFQRLHSANEFEGTGVGLAIVSRIIHKHGGRVWGESLPNSDTSFYFTIPHQKSNE